MSGLRISLSVVSDEPSIRRQLQVTIQNAGEKDLLVPLGIINNTNAYADRLKLVLTTADGKHPRVIFTGTPGVISGRLDALVAPLLSGVSYTVPTPMDKYYVLDGSEKIGEVLFPLLASFRSSLDIRNVICSPYGYPNPNMLTCWQGRVVSNPSP